MIGVKTPVYQGGQMVGYIKKYSDTLLLKLLATRMPDKGQPATTGYQSAPDAAETREDGRVMPTRMRG